MSAKLFRGALYVAIGIFIGFLAGCAYNASSVSRDSAEYIHQRPAKPAIPGAEPLRTTHTSSPWPQEKLAVYPPIIVPHYIDCLLQPKLEWNDKRVTCADLRAAQEEWKRSSDYVVMDNTKCLGYLYESEVARNMLGRRKVFLRRGTTDFEVFLQVFCEDNFAYVRDLSKFMPPDGRVAVLDAGANVGLASLILEAATRFNGAVLAVDAVASTTEMLRQNVAASGGRIMPLHSAIVAETFAAEHPTINVTGPQSQFWGFKVEHELVEYSSRVAEVVKTVSLKGLAQTMPARKFDWIKLDIEGEEAKLLVDPASREVLCTATCLFMELHEWLVPGCQAAFDDFMAWACGGRGAFAQVSQTGEYTLLCKASAIRAAALRD